MEPIDQAGILNHARPEYLRSGFVGEHDLILLDLDFPDFSFFGHCHKGTVIYILYGDTAQFAKQELNSLYSVKMPMMPLLFSCEGKPNQAARQGLSARIRFASANTMLNFASCF